MTKAFAGLAFRRVSIIGLILYSLILNSFAISFASKRVTDENIFADNSKGDVQVTVVIAGGASDRAGMLVGDIIVRINGQTFRNAGQADQILRSAKPNSTMLYDIIRDGQPLTLEVRAAQQEIRIHQIAALLMFIIVSLFALLLEFQKNKTKGTSYFIFSYIALATFFSLSVNVVQAGIGGGNIFILLQLSSLFGLPLFTHALVYIPRSTTINAIEKYVVRINYGLTVVIVIAAVVNIFHATQQQIILIVNIFYIGINFLSALVIAVIRKGEIRRVRVFLFLSVIFSYVGLIFFQISSNVVVVRSSWLFLAYLFVPVSYYLFVRYRFFNILFVVKKSLQYQFALNTYYLVLLFGSLTLISVLTMINLGDLNFHVTPTSLEIDTIQREGFSDRPFFVFLGIFFSLSLVWFSRRFKGWLNRKFAREEYNYRMALSDFSAVIASQVRLEDLYLSIVAQLERFMPIKGVALLMKEKDHFTLVASVGYSDSIQQKLAQTPLELPERLHSLSAKQLAPLASEEFSDIHIAVPLYIKSRTKGYVLLGEKKSEIAYSRSDFEFAEAIAMQSAIAIENKRLSEDARKSERLREELELAKQIQLGLLPHETPNLPKLDLYGFYHAAEEVGGDYYDFFYRKNGSDITHVTAVLGDVSGKGISASLYMTRFQGVMSSLFYADDLSPRGLLARTNASVRRDIARNAFVTCLCAEFDLEKATVKYARAGHVPLIHFCAADKTMNQLTSNGIGLGIGDEEIFQSTLEEANLQLAEGDLVVLVSDGVTEAMNAAGNEFDMTGIEKVLKKYHKYTSARIGSELLSEIYKFTQTDSAHDDITFIIAKAI
jgi:serine phosphatase RsbU (regulator of sigma subunit)